MNTKALNTLFMGGTFIFALLWLDQCNKKRNAVEDAEQKSVNLINALNDSLRYFKNKDSLSVATISTISTESTKAFTDLNISNSEVKALQQEVKNYQSKLKAGSSVTKASINTIIKESGVTAVKAKDTIWLEDQVYIYSEYSDSLINKWITYRARMNKDSAFKQIEIKNDFAVILGEEKGKPFADLITENPYSSTKSFRTYQIAVPKKKVKKIGIGPNMSYGFNSDFKKNIYIGLGIQYNFIRL